MDIGIHDKNIKIVKKLISMKEIDFFERYRDYRRNFSDNDSKLELDCRKIFESKREQINNFRQLDNYLENMKSNFIGDNREIEKLNYEQKEIKKRIKQLQEILD
tara:strand:- start:3179 stop:3490 length:312 start_codon:yes stop_codon:yes gene_type:complete